MNRMHYALLALICLCASLSGCAEAPQSAAPGQEALKEMHIAFLGDKAEDAILLSNGDFAVLVDTGLNKTGAEIVAYLDEMGINRLDLLILTHYDKDHVGGADTVIENIDVARILGADYESDAKQYKQFIKAASKKGLAVERLSADCTLALEDLTLKIDVPDIFYAQENDRSLVVRAEYGSCSLLLAGDAENERLAELLREGVEPCTLLKVPHHGRIEDLSQQFIAAALPQAAVITSADKELEDDLLVAWLQSAGAQVYLTRLGFVEAVCDGISLRLTQSLY